MKYLLPLFLFLPLMASAQTRIVNGVSGTECIMLDASTINADTTAGCAIADVAGTVFDFTVCDFSDGADDFGAWTFQLPDNLTGTTFVANYFWSTATCTSDTNDDACFTVAAAGVSNDEAWNTATLGTAVGDEDTCTTANDLYKSPDLTVTHGWSPDDRAIVEVSRDEDGGLAACAADNISNAVRLHAVKVCYEVDNPLSGE